MIEEPSETALAAARDVRVGVGRLRRRLRETYDQNEITASQTSVLGRLDRFGPSSAAELAAAEGVTHQSATLWVSALTERGLVDRAPDPTDGRRQVITLSADGLAFLSSRRAESEHWLAQRIAEQLTPDEQRTVIDAMALLERVAAP